LTAKIARNIFDLRIMDPETILVNRAPVLTLWAAVVAERLGYDREAALSLGKAVAGLNAQTKGRALGIYKPAEKIEGAPPKKVGLGEELWIELLGRPVPAKNTKQGVRAVVEDKPIEPEGVERYLTDKFGSALQTVIRAMEALATAFDPKELAARAFPLYERFRPEIPAGVSGWGVKGELDLNLIRSLAKKV
jgi:hypothetical protein